MFFKKPKSTPSLETILIADEQIKKMIQDWIKAELEPTGGMITTLEVGFGRLVNFNLNSIGQENGLAEYNVIQEHQDGPLERLEAYIPRIYTRIGRSTVEYIRDSAYKGLSLTSGVEDDILKRIPGPLWLLVYLIDFQSRLKNSLRLDSSDHDRGSE